MTVIMLRSTRFYHRFYNYISLERFRLLEAKLALKSNSQYFTELLILVRVLAKPEAVSLNVTIIMMVSFRLNTASGLLPP